MSKLGASIIGAFQNIIAPVVEYSSCDSAPISPVSYTLAEEVYLLVHAHQFAQAFQRLANCRLPCAGESSVDLEIDFDGLKTFLGVSTKLKQPLEWAEVNFVRIFLMHAPNHCLCFEAFGLLAEQYYCFNRQDLADKLSVAYLEALRKAESVLRAESNL